MICWTTKMHFSKIIWKSSNDVILYIQWNAIFCLHNYKMLKHLSFIIMIILLYYYYFTGTKWDILLTKIINLCSSRQLFNFKEKPSVVCGFINEQSIQNVVFILPGWQTHYSSCWFILLKASKAISHISGLVLKIWICDQDKTTL